MVLLTCENIRKSYTEKPLITDVSISIHDTDKIGFVGVNGTGKSTLLKIVAGEMEAEGGSITTSNELIRAYLPQNPPWDENLTVLQQAMSDIQKAGGTVEEYQCRAMLSKLGMNDYDMPMSALSGGQRKRVAMAAALVRKSNLLILDEPTNHMDIVGKEALEQMLKSYTGTVLFVSHDRYFIKEIATGILDFQADKVQYYPCTYEEYLEQKQKEAQGLIGGNKTNAAGNSGKSRNVAGEAADNRNISQVGSQSNPPTLSDVFDKKTYYNPGKIISRLKQQLVKYEKMLGESEERLAELQMQQMDTALATDYEKLTELEQAIAAEQSNQESILDRLVETETELDEMQEKTV